jgi:hypothetical protein
MGNKIFLEWGQERGVIKIGQLEVLWLEKQPLMP